MVVWTFPLTWYATSKPKDPPTYTYTCMHTRTHSQPLPRHTHTHTHNRWLLSNASLFLFSLFKNHVFMIPYIFTSINQCRKQHSSVLFTPFYRAQLNHYMNFHSALPLANLLVVIYICNSVSQLSSMLVLYLSFVFALLAINAAVNFAIVLTNSWGRECSPYFLGHALSLFCCPCTHYTHTETHTLQMYTQT